MPGLVPGIHVFLRLQLVDGRAEASGSDTVLRTAMPGHDTGMQNEIPFPGCAGTSFLPA